MKQTKYEHVKALPSVVRAEELGWVPEPDNTGATLRFVWYNTFWSCRFSVFFLQENEPVYTVGIQNTFDESLAIQWLEASETRLMAQKPI